MADSILPPAAPAPVIRTGKARTPPPPQPAGIYLDALAVAAVISDPTRFRILQIMAPGVAFAAVHLEYILRRERRALARHLEVLRMCGLVVEEKGSKDGRIRLNRIRPELLRGVENGRYIVDYGSGVLRIEESSTTFERPPGWSA